MNGKFMGLKLLFLVCVCTCIYVPVLTTCAAPCGNRAWITEKLLCIRTPYFDTHLNTRMYMSMHTDTFGVDTGGCGREEVAQQAHK